MQIWHRDCFKKVAAVFGFMKFIRENYSDGILKKAPSSRSNT